MKYHLAIPPFVEQTIVHLPTALKRKIRYALEAIREDPHIGKPLKDELRGLWSYRVARYRIVYRIYHSRIEIQIIDIGPRSLVYEHVIQMMKEQSD
ncbi:MAG: type II toxin-antitoxin system RelE/ParE family toxin [Candidatus Omnitrophica bacterium]|nr:type II toxin-antitoxin system RelE/ParE family toxin [Candidatus Omnitrophota bacterium]